MTEKTIAGIAEIAATREAIKASLPSVEEIMQGDNAPQVFKTGEDVPEIKQEEPQEKETHIEDKTNEETQKEDIPAVKVNDYDDQARLDGWAPKDEYKGDPKIWIDSKEWISRAPLLHKITNQSKEIKTMAKTNNAMAKMLHNLTERMDQDRANNILVQKREAIEQGDVTSVERYEKEYNDIIRSTQEAADSLPQNSSVEPEITDFLQRNSSWYNDKAENVALTAYAKQIESELATARPDLTLDQRLTATENIVKDDPRYITKFSNQNRNRPAAVEGKTAPEPRVKNKITFADLPSDVKQVLLLQREKEPRLNLDAMAQKLLDTGAVKHE